MNNAKKTVDILNSAFGGEPRVRPKRKPPGQAPGTVVHTGHKRMDEVLITVHDFDERDYESFQISKIENSEPYLQSDTKTWIQVKGLHDIDKLENVWDYFNLHPLVREDIVNTYQRPKVEDYQDHLFFVLRMLTTQHDNNAGYLKTEQISIVLGKNYVLSFQETDSPVFEPVIKRIQSPLTRVRQLGPDYLAYALIDNIVDHYFTILDVLSDSIESFEDQIIQKSDNKHLHHIHQLRRDLIYFRKTVWSLRDGINSLLRDNSTLIASETKIYIRDVYDHIVQVIDSIENNREMIYSLSDIHMSGLSNKMNEVMKVLTMIATIFIPLTFIAGIYGMNFDPKASPLNMPELNWYFGYPLSLLIMLIVALGMIQYFRHKKWL